MYRQDKRFFQKTPLVAALSATALFTLAPQDTFAVVLPDAVYNVYVNTTPTAYAYGLGTFYKVGKDGAWNSSFTFGGTAPSATSSQGMTDNGSTSGTGQGSSIASDGYAGHWVISVEGATVTFNNTGVLKGFNEDVIYGTAGGDFAQYGTVTGTGTINQSTGALSLIPTGRLGAINSPIMVGNRWNVSDTNSTACAPNGATALNPLTTGSASTTTATITGAAVTPAADVDSDGLPDYQSVLVSGGFIGSDWVSFCGAQYFETYNIRLELEVQANDDSEGTFPGAFIDVDVLANDKGNGTLVFSGFTQGSNGTVAQVGAILRYTPNGGFAGSDSFTYTIKSQNGAGPSHTGTVTIEVQDPAAIADSASTNQNAAVPINVVANDLASAGTSINAATVTIVTPPNTGTYSSNASGVVTYTPDSGFVGQDTFTYTVENDVGSISNVATVTVTVSAVAMTSDGTYGPGSLAVNVRSMDGRISTANVEADGGVTSQCLGGCYDFQITGATGGSPVMVVLKPLSVTLSAQNIADGTRYRKYMDGTWKTLDTSAGDAVASAPLTAGGGCPAPGGTWKTWTNATADNAHVGDSCLRLTLADNGLNDSSPDEGTIADPGGLGAGTPTAVERAGVLDEYSGSSGCSIANGGPTSALRGDWWLLGGFLVWLHGLMRWRKRSCRDQA